jgi:hypothetical protein
MARTVFLLLLSSGWSWCQTDACEVEFSERKKSFINKELHVEKNSVE